MNVLTVGQVVELVNQPPNYGRSLDGTLARVEWVPSIWMGSVMVELYRKHRRTGKPLALRTYLMSVKQLAPVEELTPEQAALLELVEPLRQEQQARRQKMKADRLAWQEGILKMEKNDQGLPPASPSETTALAQEGLTLLEDLLTRQPPEGITSAEVAGFFQRQRKSLLDALAVMLDALAKKQVTAPSSDPSARKLKPVTASPELRADLKTLIEEGEEFTLHVLVSGETYKFLIQPDFDGLYISVEGERIERKLASTEASELLGFLPDLYPAVEGASLVAMTNSYLTLYE